MKPIKMKEIHLSERRRKEIAEAEKLYIKEKNPINNRQQTNKLNKTNLSSFEMDEMFGGIENE